ncbi:MAG TPA: Rieske 2Fe-2S domain-containing protein [Candidatus Thermoplasmatota archaeon]|nr:Rieske 2Fe-2S domain-containing protein [Candidatus Thermoplasmatota archaeon]
MQEARTVAAPRRTPTFARFARQGVVCEGWYAVADSSALRMGDVRRAWIGARDLVVYRERGGEVRCAERACPHLGADLTQGEVGAKGLQCAFHGWCWGADGACRAGGGVAEGRRLRVYETRERWGLVWAWAGDRPAYDLPAPDRENAAHVLRLPEQHLACHPHLMLGNGLDTGHAGPVHRMRFEEPVVEIDAPHRVSARLTAHFRPTWLRRVLGLAGGCARWRFTTIGPSFAWVTVESPTPFELVWAGRPLPDGGCAARTIFFLPRRRTLVRALPMMVATTWADRRVLEGLDFKPGFVPSDSVFAAYAELVEAMPVWSEEVTS